MVKKTRKRPGTKRTALWLILLFMVGASAAAWWLWPLFYQSSAPRFNSLLIEKDGQALKLLEGELLQLHPQDRIRILGVSSNIFLNRGLRLFASDFDVNALFHEALSVSALLPNRDPFDRYSFRIVVKHNNRELGHVDVLVEPHIEDWLDKADRTIDAKRKSAILEKALILLPGDPRIRERLIQTYISRKQWFLAAQLLERMAEQKPTRETFERLLEVYGEMADGAGTIRVLKRLVELEPENVEAQIRLASALEASQRLEEAVQVYQKALDRLGKEEKGAVYKTIGYLLTKSNQDQKAIAAYLKALELDQSDPNLYYNLSSLYERTGRQDKADIFLSKALALKSEDTEGRLFLAERLVKAGKMKEAETYLNEVLEKSPKTVEALLLMIQIAEARKDKRSLIEAYQKIHAIQPGNETIIYNLGVLEYETGDLAKSLDYFKKLAAVHPEDVELHTFLFDIYKRQKKDSLAFEEARILVTLNPKDAGPYDYMFDYLSSRADYQGIISIMEQGLKSHPGNTDLMEYGVLAYLKTGQEGLALRQMKKILTVRPKDLDLLLQLAKLQEKQGDLEGAIETHEKILALSPKHKEAGKIYPALVLQRAEALEGQEKWNDALEMYQKVLAVSPGHEKAGEATLRVLLQLARQQEEEKKFGHALQSYQKLLALSPGHGDALQGYIRVLLRLAQQQERESKYSEALQTYQRVLDLSPGHEEAAEAYLRLRLRVLPGDVKEQ